MKMAITNLTVVSYNLHGINQGLSYLQELLLHNDIICVQEHWLSSADSNILYNLNKDFTTVASFAVDSILDKGILGGRPFGGMAAFVKYPIMIKFKIVSKGDRLIVLQVNNVLIFNVYMPCNDAELFTCIVGSIAEVICNKAADVSYCIVAGDFNLNFRQSDPLWDVMNCFLNACNLCLTVDHIVDSSAFTYRHQSLGHTSFLDYILISKNLSHLVTRVDIQDSGLNLSDHIPVILNLNFNFDIKCDVNFLDNKDSDGIKIRLLRWDKADLYKYYQSSFSHLYPVYLDLCNLSELPILDEYYTIIHDVYDRIIAALRLSDKVIPRASSNCFKHWWNSSLDVYKINSRLF